MAKLETKKMLAAAVAAAEDKQAVDLRILELDPSESGLTDYFLVMSGSNSRQMQTLADEIELKLKQQYGQLPNSREGYRQAEWILLDYVDFVVHIFSEEKRAFYAIERLRKSATSVTPEELRAALVAKTVKARGKADSEKAVGKVAVGKKVAGGRSVTGVPTGAKSVGSKGIAKKSAKKASAKAGARSAGKKAGKSAARASKPIARGKNKLKAAPKSTPKSRKRS